MSPMSFWKVVLLFIILGGQAMAKQLWSLQPLKRTEVPRAGDAQNRDGHTDIAANPRHLHDLDATILHLCGIDHERLTYRSNGRDFRLTDVDGNVVKEILA